MKPVFQTQFGEGNGDCWRACLASLLHLDIDDVPLFIDRPDFFNEAQTWLIVMGFWLLAVEWPHPKDPRRRPFGYHIMVGPGPRGHQHAVIGFQGEMVHDPHPDGTGLVSVESYEFLIPLQPVGGSHT